MEKPSYAYPGAVGFSVAHRASLATELANKIAQQDARDAEVKAWLLAVAPDNIREWIEEQDVIGIVYIHGRYSLHALFDFKDHDDAKRIVRELNKAWKGLIRTTLSGVPEDLDIEFAAVNGING